MAVAAAAVAAGPSFARISLSLSLARSFSIPNSLLRSSAYADAAVIINYRPCNDPDDRTHERPL